MKIQFLLKKNETYGFISYHRKSSGLWNSTRYIVEALNARGVEVDIQELNDNNEIDREVARFKPDLVVIEAFWVVPTKFDILKKLHPKIKWFVHLHSGIPFLSIEGIAMEWAKGCAERGVKLIANSKESFDALNVFLEKDSELIYLPNVYLPDIKPVKAYSGEDQIHIGCFGAIRPLKNQLIQALAAIQFAKEIGRPLKFHVNHSRVETMGHPVIKNLIALFDGLPDAELIQEPWMDSAVFRDLLENVIDLSMQVSLSETFNVVSADAVSCGVPIVVSKEVKWVSFANKADDDSIEDIVRIMHRVWRNKFLAKWNQYLLKQASKEAQDQWHDFVIKYQWQI